MIEIVLASNDAEDFRNRLVGGDTEGCAILFASQTSRKDGTVRLLVRETQFPEQVDYTRRGLLEAELSPDFVARVTKRALRKSLALIFVHSHPGEEFPNFSRIDTQGEKHLAAFLSRRHPAMTHAALVVSAGGMRARRLGRDEDIRIISIGRTLDVLFDPSATVLPTPKVFDRQVRAFGSAGQQALQKLRVAIVGLGGTGSLVSEQLVHLGVNDFILMDPDVLETTNLNRVAHATFQDIGHPKVEIAAKYIRAITRNARPVCIQGDVIRASTARELQSADFIFGCTDSHGSRAVLQQISYQYLIPCIDMGVTIATTTGQVTHIYGRVQLLAPGLACLVCNELLDGNEVRQDMMTTFERKADPYILGEREPAPAVMSLNSTVASLAVTMLLSVVTKLPMSGRHVLYNAIATTLRTVGSRPKADCYICSRSGALARGDSWPLLARQD